ncbi:peptidoglycan-binding domain-containing protein [Bifidobacterium vansinderenii]|uniref:Peptidoglycan-binding protein n=1 Tax=Bifidobacterium vansinderenii TaxID=1984871 RepID=A0A229W0X7_9BIFI|nr:peptidoglycan-binding domain-containing protein [Bifidobacterium vansinderenii]OXN01310.1 peptidoglycan-binding protein [Bifidobacterium vansinderenii]
MKRVVSWLIIVVLAVVPLVGVGVFSWVQARDPEELAPKPTAVLQKPTTITDDGSVNATITATYRQGTAVLAPAWQETVTGVSVAPGATVSTGTELLKVDGVARLAAASASPFYRSLTVNDKGEDVRDLESVLQTLGYFKRKPNTVFDDATRVAVIALEKRIGVANPSGVFDPGWLVWLPADQLTVGSVNVQVNQQAPAAGETVFVSASSLDAISTSTAGGAFAFNGTYVLSQHGQDVATVSRAEDVNQDLLGRLQADDSSNADARQYQVSLRYEQPVQALSVPSAAVLTDKSGGSTCVYGKYSSKDAKYRAVAVTVTSGTLGKTHVQYADDLADFYVLADPLTIMGEGAQCPSK